MVNPKYQGDQAVALTSFKDRYDIQIACSEEALRAGTDYNKRVLGSSFEVMKRYLNLSDDGVKIVIAFAKKLESGEETDIGNLEKTLE